MKKFTLIGGISLAYIGINLIVAYRIGAVQRLNEMTKYMREHPLEEPCTTSELWDYVLKGGKRPALT